MNDAGPKITLRQLATLVAFEGRAHRDTGNLRKAFTRFAGVTG